MTVANNYAPARYVGNGSTRSFAVSWRLENDDDFVVYQKVGGVQSVVDPSNYTAVNTDNEHGVVFNTAPANGTIIVITRATPHEQDTPYKTSSGFQAIKVEEDFDSLTMMVQELQNGVDRAVKVPETSTETQQHFSDSLFAARDEAQSYAQAAHVSEANAAGSATNAHYSEENAEIFAGRAETAATTATNKADAAAASATTAGQKATLAGASATSAYQSELNAKDWAVSESLVDGTYYGARHYARLASESADEAYASSTNASTERGLAEDAARAADEYLGGATAAANLAMQWAIKMDGKVDDYEYSAKYYADLAGQNAGVLSGANKDLSNLTAAGEAKFDAKQDVIDSSHKLSASLVSGLANVATSGAYSDLNGTPTLATVATSGSYNDLSNKPDLSGYALDNAVVKLTGTQTIAGTKTFSSDPYIKNASAQLYMDDTQQTKGTAPSADVWSSVTFHDANGNLMGRCRQIYAADKSNKVELQVHKANSSSDTDSATMGIKYPSSGSAYGFAPNSDVNGSILTTIDKTKATKGHFWLGNGMLVNWGKVAADDTDVQTVSFDKAYSAVPCVLFAYNRTNDTDYNNVANCRDYLARQTSTTGFKFVNRNIGSDAYTVWYAIGYRNA